MLSLYGWAIDGPVGTFRTQDFLIRSTRHGFEVRYRSPLWSRLPVRKVSGFCDVADLLGVPAHRIFGMGKR